ncbi:uncharacterized protein LOC121052961 [Rosa chinensis]|uniref:uncharacterized protein LOC121052961 n=1 Tax=Rosa chinensis TaxID=74649 RepID=UPI001AD8C697|nr:uncharacterized protein LOC121052961 [Rosa chinensis]
MSILSLLLKLSSGWRSKKSNVDIVCRSSSMIVKKFKVEGLYIVCSTDVVKHLRYMQVLKIWDILPDLCSIQSLVNRLDCFFVRHTDGFIKLCCMKYFEGNLEVPMIWPASLDVIRYKDLCVTSDSVDDVSKDESYVENSKGRELVLPFEVTDEEMEAILYNRSTFIAGRSGTGKTTVLTMKLFQKEQYYNMAEEGLYAVEQSSGGFNATVLRQIFVTVSPELCIAVKQHVSNLKRDYDFGKLWC